MDERIKEKLINRAKTNPYVNFLGTDFTVIEEGRMGAYTPLHGEQRRYNGVTHRGVLAALVDTITGFAAYMMTPLEKDMLMAELKMLSLRVAWGNELIAKGTVIRAGRNIHLCECEIYCDDKLVSKSSGTFCVVHPQAQKGCYLFINIVETSNVKRIFRGRLLFAAMWPVFGQPATNPRLIIHADDMGSFRSANTVCMEGHKGGVETCIEIMVITLWFSEAARLLRENPRIDVGLHLTFTSEWDSVKQRPLTHCPSLADSNGYLLSMMSPNPAYPGLAILENTWGLAEIEQGARAQVEMALKNTPQTNHISGHMGSTGFDSEVAKLMHRLSEEYHLPAVGRVEAMQEYDFTYSRYDGVFKTPTKKEASFIRMLDESEPGKRYMSLDHPALNNEGIKTVGHVGHENVAMDRQGVTDLLTSLRIKQALKDKNMGLTSYNDLTREFPRAEASKALDKAFGNYLRAVKKTDQDLHNIMILQHEKVVKE